MTQTYRIRNDDAVDIGVGRRFRFGENGISLLVLGTSVTSGEVDIPKLRGQLKQLHLESPAALGASQTVELVINDKWDNDIYRSGAKSSGATTHVMNTDRVVTDTVTFRVEISVGTDSTGGTYILTGYYI